MNLVTLDQARARLRIDLHHGDADLYSMIEEASSVVTRYVKYGKTEVGDDEPVQILDWSEGVPYDVQLATLIAISNIERGEHPMSQAVIDILTPYRDPTLA